MQKPPLAKHGLKGPRSTNSGSVKAVVSVTKNGRDAKPPRIVAESHEEVPVEDPGPEDARGFSGVGIGLTIPGPERSFKVARVDVHVGLPHPATRQGTVKALAISEKLVTEKLQELAAQVQSFWDD